MKFGKVVLRDEAMGHYRAIYKKLEVEQAEMRKNNFRKVWNFWKLRKLQKAMQETRTEWERVAKLPKEKYAIARLPN